MGGIGPQEVRNAQPFDASVIGISSKHRDPAPTWSKVISHKLSDKFSTNVYSRCWMNHAHYTILAKSPNFNNLGLSSVHTSGELGSVFIPTTRIGRPSDGSNWLPPDHCIGEVTADIVSRKKPEQKYNFKSYFETRRGGLIDQDFGRQNNYMIQPPLDSTPLGTNTNNRKTSQSYSIPVRTKYPEAMPLTLSTDFQNKM